MFTTAVVYSFTFASTYVLELNFILVKRDLLYLFAILYYSKLDILIIKISFLNFLGQIFHFAALNFDHEYAQVSLIAQIVNSVVVFSGLVQIVVKANKVREEIF